MASCAKPFSLLFLLFLTHSLQIQARESQFFSKNIRSDAPNETTNPVENQVPTAKEEYPTTTTNENQSGYGLYGHETEPTTAYNNEPFNTPGEYESKQFVDNTNNWQFNTPAEHENKEFGGLAGDEKKRYGMSDTRFLEKGKYYYDVSKDTNYDPDAYVTGRSKYNTPATATEQTRNDLNNYATYATQEQRNGYTTEGRGGYNGVTNAYPTEGHGGYNGVTNAYSTEGHGGYEGVTEQGRGGYNGVTEQGRGGYNGPATTKVDARSRYGGYYGSSENGNGYKKTVGGYQNDQQNEFDELKEEYTP